MESKSELRPIILEYYQLRLTSLSVAQRSLVGDRRHLRSTLSETDEVIVYCDDPVEIMDLI